MTGYCPRTGKVSYDSPAEARRSARGVTNRSGMKAHHYRCTYCSWWHLSRVPNDKIEAQRRRQERRRSG